jgi:hypothetical protein
MLTFSPSLCLSASVSAATRNSINIVASEVRIHSAKGELILQGILKHAFRSQDGAICVRADAVNGLNSFHFHFSYHDIIGTTLPLRYYSQT